MKRSIERMTGRIAELLAPCSPTVYLYGSAVLDDFRFGWSDIDLLVLTRDEMSAAQAEQLVGLRQTLLLTEPDNPYYRAFEGAMLRLSAFTGGEKCRVVYWGTSGQRVKDSYSLDSFCMNELLDSGVLLTGDEVRDLLPRPAGGRLRADVRRCCESVKGLKAETFKEESLYSFGWLLDISRCLYTLRTGRIIAKTAAGEWALAEKLCPCESALATAVELRKAPWKFYENRELQKYTVTLADTVLTYNAVLEAELLKSNELS